MTWQDALPGAVFCLVMPTATVVALYILSPLPRYRFVEKRVAVILVCDDNNGFCRVRFEDGTIGEVRFPIEGRAYRVQERVK